MQKKEFVSFCYVFVSAMMMNLARISDILQDLVNKLSDDGMLVPPVPFDGQDFPIVQYADDTLLFLEASFAHLQVLKQTLHTF
jgi:hypothetical protein